MAKELQHIPCVGKITLAGETRRDRLQQKVQAGADWMPVAGAAAVALLFCACRLALMTLPVLLA